MSSSLLSRFFFNFLAFFRPVLVVSYLQIQKTKVVGLYNFYYTISLQFSKFLDLQLAFETETRPRPRLAKMGLETPSLMIIHICGLVLQQSYPVSNYFPKKNKNQFRIDLVEIWAKLIFETFLLLVYFNVLWLCFCYHFYLSITKLTVALSIG